MEKQKETREELAKDIANKLAELYTLEQTSEILKDNRNEFTYNEKYYRVHRPVAWEKDLCNNERMKKYVEFLKDPSYVFRKQLIILLANKGYDVNAIEDYLKRLGNQERDLLKRLAQTELEPDVSNLKKEIREIRLLQQDVFMEKEERLKYCIEKQLEDFVRCYLLYLVLEVKNGEKWERHYKSYEDFQNADEDILLGRAAQVLGYLVYNDQY